MGNLPSLNPKIHGLRTNTKVPCSLFDAWSSAGQQKFGALANQGKQLLRFLWRGDRASAARRDPELQRFYRHRLVHKGLKKARRLWAASCRNSALDHFAERD